MGRYVVGRLLQAIPVIILSSIGVFTLLHVLPGDAAQVLAGPDASNEQVEAVRQDLGLDQPLPIQYLVWVQHLLRFDLGTSIFSKRPIAQLILDRAPATLELASIALILSVPVGIALGVIAAVFQRRRIDYIITTATSFFIAVPNFWFGILLILLFAVVLGWLPPGGRADLFAEPLLELKFLALPALTLALPNAMGLSRLTKATTLEVLHEDYVRTARAKGLAGRAVVLRHVLRNALVPISTSVGLEIGRLLGGSVIIESVFGWPGLGLLTLSGINNRDYAVVQATLLLLVFVYITVNLMTDLLYGVLDPRIRLTGRRTR